MQPELNSELEKIHIQIAKMLGLSRDLLTFHYSNEDGKTTLQLATMNPRHQQTFLFHTTQGFGEMDALNKMQEYVQENKNTRSTYTIQWAMEGINDLHTSYFTGKNIYEVLDKFYYGKAITSTIIFNISLNPLS
jgi:nanoRNase/pAp phosphatase (c-di-AMP/oligoRNAs hydrolase)